jgi:hypothetical protein
MELVELALFAQHASHTRDTEWVRGSAVTASTTIEQTVRIHRCQR